MFKFIVDGKDVIDNRIQWKFAGTDLEFRSDENRLERNIEFWRKKYNVGADVEVEFLNVKKAEENVKPIITESSLESIDVIDHSVVASEPVVSQDTENIQSTDKPKRRKKAI